MALEHLKVEHADGIAIVRIDRPAANAIELELVGEFESLFASLAAPDVRAVVVTGTGNFFSAGLDLKSVPYYGREEQRELVARVNRMIGKLYGWPIPFIAAVNGHALAGGLILAIACDYRIGPQGDYKFGLTEARVGIPFPAGPMAVLLGELSPAAARVITLTANQIGPDRALAYGIFDELRPTDQVLGRALEVAKDMATIPREAFGCIKRQLRERALGRIEEVVENASDPMLAHWLTAEAASASRATLKKRG